MDILNACDDTKNQQYNNLQVFLRIMHNIIYKRSKETYVRLELVKLYTTIFSESRTIAWLIDLIGFKEKRSIKCTIENYVNSSNKKNIDIRNHKNYLQSLLKSEGVNGVNDFTKEINILREVW